MAGLVYAEKAEGYGLQFRDQNCRLERPYLRRTHFHPRTEGPRNQLRAFLLLGAMAVPSPSQQKAPLVGGA
jgi:hypothetical protein